MRDPLELVFAQLDSWRHLPNYQLERRADVFFSVYLKGLVEKTTRVELEDVLIPELPLRCGVIWPERPSNKSVKVDYALFAKDGSKVFFIELKTDSSSRREKQDDYLTISERLGFRPIVLGIRELLLETNAHQKYHHLASMLSSLGYLRLPEDLNSYLYPTVRPGLTDRLRLVEVSEKAPAVEVIYLQPQATEGDRCIDFERFATYVERFTDPLSRAFATHLRRWNSPAGATPP